MKNFIGIGVCFFSLLGVAAAQSETIVHFKLPANTMLGDTKLPAGDYTVRDLESDTGSAVLDFRGPGGLNKNVLAIPTTINPNGADKTEVRLKPEGHHMQVDRIAIEGDSRGFQIVQ